jgi:hypothetical protein
MNNFVQIKYSKNNKMKNGADATAHNRTVYASPPSAARATKNHSRPTAFVQFFSATFLRLLETYGFLYRNRKTVIYSRNVMRNAHTNLLNGGVHAAKKVKNYS